MVSYNTFLRKSAWKSASCLLFFLAGPASAAPVIQQASGTLKHKGAVTISGSGFGTKGTAAPVVWDDASTGTMLTDNGKWDDAWPTQVDSSAYYIRYTTPINGISLPHNNITRYIAGGHGNVGWTLQVEMWKTRTISSFPAYFYATWYSRADDNWTFAGDDSDNYKCFTHSSGGKPYDENGYWYAGLNPLHSKTEVTAWGALSTTGSGTNPMAGKWVKTEVEMKISQQSDGFFRLRDNGVLRLSYSGITDGPKAAGTSSGSWSGNTRTEVIGGFGRPYGKPNNWRYFADVYYDYSLARVVLANNANLSNATIIEPQIPSSWSSGSINVSVNLGKFTAGQTAYLFVFDSSGAPNATGFPVTVGGTGGGETLNPPQNLSIP